MLGISGAATDLHQGSNLASIQLSLSFALELALALSVKRYTRSMKVIAAVELLVQETFQLCNARLSHSAAPSL